MKKIRIGLSVFILFAICLIFKNFIVLLNYLIALLLHEMAHLFVATRRGYKLKQFKFDMLGMSVELDSELDNSDSFIVNIAGPFMNLFLCLICMALYWAVPVSFQYLNMFCISNLCLALFNLLPVYPLDGGKIFAGLFKRNDKMYRKIDIIVRILFCVMFAMIFFLSLANDTNYYALIMLIFFATSKAKKTTTYSMFRNSKKKNYEKVSLIKINEKTDLLTLLKLIKKQNYTIFYCPNCDFGYFDEDYIIGLAMKYPLPTKLQDIKNK